LKASTIFGFAIGPFGSAAIGLLTLPILAWNFTPEDIAKLNILQVTISFSILIFVLGLDQSYVREYHESKNTHELFNACFTPGFILLIISSIISLNYRDKITLLLYGESNTTLYTLTIICIIFSYISRYLSLILRMQERGYAYSLSQITPKALQLILLTGLIAFLNKSLDFSELLHTFTISTISITLVYAAHTKKELSKSFSSRIKKDELKNLLRFGVPLVATGVAYWGLTATSTIMLRSKSSLEELGIYSITVSIAGVASIFQSIFSVIWMPTVYKWVNQGLKFDKINEVANQAMAALVVLFSIIGSFSWAIELFLPPSYSNIKYMILCAIAPPLLYTISEITSIGIGITRKSILTTWITLISLLSNISLNYWLIPIYGAKGAVAANSLSYLIFFIARTEFSARVWKRLPRAHLYILSSSIVALAIITVFFGPNFPFHYSIPWLIQLPIAYFIYRVKINLILLSLCKKLKRHLQY